MRFSAPVKESTLEATRKLTTVERMAVQSPEPNPTGVPMVTKIPGATLTLSPTFGRNYIFDTEKNVTPAPMSAPSLLLPSLGSLLPGSLSITMAPSSAPGGSLPSVESLSPTTQLTIPLPVFRYVEWSKLDDRTRTFAGLLGYTEDSWNVPGSAPIERRKYDTIAASSDKSRDIFYIQGLGFGKPQWDCYINHYRNFTWAELGQVGVKRYYQVLGWDSQRWLNREAPLTELKEWSALSVQERVAAESVCYLQPLWEGESLKPKDVTGPVRSSVGRPSPYRPSWLPRALSILAIAGLWP
jgi:hypothetical protein